MKTLSVLILILLLCNGSFTLSAQEYNVYAGMITLESYPIKTKDGSGSTSEPGLPIKRSIQQSIANAYLYNNIVSINFHEAIKIVNITITNESTGENVYSEAYNSPTVLNITLNKGNDDNYLIEIETNEIYLKGYFSL